MEKSLLPVYKYDQNGYFNGMTSWQWSQEEGDWLRVDNTTKVAPVQSMDQFSTDVFYKFADGKWTQEAKPTAEKLVGVKVTTFPKNIHDASVLEIVLAGADGLRLERDEEAGLAWLEVIPEIPLDELKAMKKEEIMQAWSSHKDVTATMQTKNGFSIKATTDYRKVLKDLLDDYEDAQDEPINVTDTDGNAQEVTYDDIQQFVKDISKLMREANKKKDALKAQVDDAKTRKEVEAIVAEF